MDTYEIPEPLQTELKTIRQLLASAHETAQRQAEAHQSTVRFLNVQLQQKAQSALTGSGLTDGMSEYQLKDVDGEFHLVEREEDE
jgi:hypothetical protein